MKVRGDPLLIKASVVSERTFGEIAKFIKKASQRDVFRLYLLGGTNRNENLQRNQKKILKGRAGIQTATTILVILGIVFNSQSTSEPTIIAKNK